MSDEVEPFTMSTHFFASSDRQLWMFEINLGVKFGGLACVRPSEEGCDKEASVIMIPMSSEHKPSAPYSPGRDSSGLLPNEPPGYHLKENLIRKINACALAIIPQLGSYFHAVMK